MRHRDIRLEQLPDGKLRVHYGASRGWSTFKSAAEARDNVINWRVSQMNYAARDLGDMAWLERKLKSLAPVKKPKPTKVKLTRAALLIDQVPAMVAALKAAAAVIAGGHHLDDEYEANPELDAIVKVLRDIGEETPS